VALFERRIRAHHEGHLGSGGKPERNRRAFGDLFLGDIRAYRERQLRGTALEPIFPLWQLPTHRLARDMIAGGLRAKLVCVDPRKLPPEFAGFVAVYNPTIEGF
jgi:hypothetical protein